ncbi:MAG: hypothetical protein R3C49_26850 [Planctomycetaceae bacterium]
MIYILTAVIGVLGLLSCLRAAVAVTILSGPGATKYPATWALFLAILTFPLVCLVTIWLAWAGFPWPMPIYIFALPIGNLVMGWLALLWISTFQDGMFTGPRHRKDGD